MATKKTNTRKPPPKKPTVPKPVIKVTEDPKQETPPTPTIEVKTTQEETEVEKPIEVKTRNYFSIFKDLGISRNAKDPNAEYDRGKKLIKDNPEFNKMTRYLGEYVGTC